VVRDAIVSALSSVRRILWRLRTDYGTRSRRDEYSQILRKAQEGGYQIIALGTFVQRLRSAAMNPVDRVLILRHDVDIGNVAGNRMFYEAEKELGGRATYYFRLATAPAHSELIGRLLGDGFEVGYHFEEAATVAKERRLRSREAVLGCRDEIVARFRSNCEQFRRRWNPQLRSVSSHGDWINRRLGVINNELIDEPVLASCGLDFEGYAAEIQGAVNVYVSDVAVPPQSWARGTSPWDAFRDQKRRIYMLTHERQWHGGRWAKAAADANRIWEATFYLARTRSPAGAGEPREASGR
jgi:hypothetical protein